MQIYFLGEYFPEKNLEKLIGLVMHFLLIFRRILQITKNSRGKMLIDLLPSCCPFQ